MRAVLDQIAEGKAVELPVMSTAELCALGALAHSVLDAPALAWWNEQPDKEKLTRLAYAATGRRKLLDPDTGRLLPPLGLILAGRSRPSFVLLTRDSPEAEPRNARAYGIADESGLRAVLTERSRPNPGAWTGPVYFYLLGGVAAQSDALAGWAVGGKHRTIDLYRPGSGITGPAERLVVSPARRHRLSVDRQTPDAEAREHLACDQQGLAALVARIMTGESQ